MQFPPEEGRLLPTRCPREGCFEKDVVDTVQHVLQCREMGPIPSDPGDLVPYLMTLAARAGGKNPGLPLPYRAPTEMDLELDLDLEEEAEGVVEAEEIDENELSPAEISLDPEDWEGSTLI